MKKSNFAAMILGAIGIVFFALGMCMALIEDWGLFRQGIVCGVVGLAVLLAALLIWRRMEGKPPIHLSVKTVETILVAVPGRRDRRAFSGDRDVHDHGVWPDGLGHCNRSGGHCRPADADSSDQRV